MQLAIKNIFEYNNEEKNKILLLRISFWIGAILDAIYAINMGLVWLIESYSGLDPINLVRFTSDLESRYAWGVSASLMLAWTVLLIWADRKPVERKSISLFTAFPLLIGLLTDTIWAIEINLTSIENIALTSIVYIFLIILFTFSYWNVRSIESAG